MKRLVMYVFAWFIGCIIWAIGYDKLWLSHDMMWLLFAIWICMGVFSFIEFLFVRSLEIKIK